MHRTMEEMEAEQNARAEAALAQVPVNIASLIVRSRMRLTLALALHTVFNARRREEITRAAGFFDGLVFAENMMGCAWTADEWAALDDYGRQAESTALVRLEE